ncbi:ABC transporter ATP-binding protein [Clostridium sp. 19966]|uniref:ABC transporter ATP-binding protein n=1 Tax=Clostridium sp. 19966 TaxID=2768166 RepID=UPI0028DDB4B5|nr:ABC transporter ATP-binding protein [Clostridium sp. 19966]MDT8718396.1 ABC transporter ATP-binding protein [Clostridium sp. 19966]
MKEKNKRYTLSTLWNLNKYVYKCSPYKYIFYLLINAIAVIEIVVTLKATEFSTNAAYRLFTKTSQGFNYEAKIFILYAAALLLLYVISVIGQLVLKSISLDISYNFQKDINSKLSTIKWDYHEHHETAVKLHEVKTKALDSMLKLLSSSMFYFSTTLSIFAYGFFLSQINIFVVFLYLALIVFSSMLADKVFEDIKNIWDDIQPLNQRQSYFFGISGDKVTHQEFRFNRMFPFVKNRWEKYFEEEYKLRIKIFKKYEITLQTARIILNLPYVLMLIFVSYEIVIGKHDIGFLTLCQTMFNNIVNTFGSVQYQISDDKIEAKFVKSFFDTLKLKDEKINADGKAIDADIEFKNIEYSYPQAQVKSLNGVNLKINPGEKIAIVGHNGSGKTTFTNILMALTDNFKGEITIGNKKLSDMSSLRSSVSCILQDFAQYEMTIRDNIALGNIDHEFTEDEILELLEKVELKDFVLSLSEGINSRLGQLEEGIELSKGQWQRLAIARLLANPSASIWILDEPTAYLDPLSEIEIYDLIYKLAGNRTVFFISHRLGFAKKADKIIVFDTGKVVEEGTHHELMILDGIYAKMYKIQEEWYAA